MPIIGNKLIIIPVNLHICIGRYEKIVCRPSTSVVRRMSPISLHGWSGHESSSSHSRVTQIWFPWPANWRSKLGGRHFVLMLSCLLCGILAVGRNTNWKWCPPNLSLLLIGLLMVTSCSNLSLLLHIVLPVIEIQVELVPVAAPCGGAATPRVLVDVVIACGGPPYVAIGRHLLVR